MPFAVSQWPYSPDPRGPDFCSKGWNFGALPSYRWTVQTTEALYPFEPLNDGVVVESTAFGMGFVTYREVDSYPENILIGVGVLATDFIPPISPPRTITIELVCSSDIDVPAFATLLELWPEAIEVKEPFNMLVSGSPSLKIPNVVTLTPRKWNA